MMKAVRVLEKIGVIEKRSQPTNTIIDENNSVSGGFMPSIPSRAEVSQDVRSLDAVYRALQILETSTRQLTLDLWHGGKPISYQNMPLWVRKPSIECVSFGVFTAETVACLAQRGNAFWHVIRSKKDNSVIALEVLNPFRVNVTMNQYGYRQYTLDGEKIKRNEIMHLRLTHTPNEPLGVSPLQACERLLKGAIQTQNFAAHWTKTAGAPAGILTTDQPLSPEQAKEYKKQANQNMQYDQGIAVLGNGLTYRKLLFTPAEIQFIESQRDSVTKIARMFGIPAKMLMAAVDGSSDTYSNAETENQQFARLTLMSYLAEIEDAFTELLPRGTSARFNLDGLLRSDTKTRYEAHNIAIKAGFLTINEVRAIEGLQPLPEQQTEQQTKEENTQDEKIEGDDIEA